MKKWSFQNKKGKASKKEETSQITLDNPFDILKKNKTNEMDEKICEGKRLFDSYLSVKTSI